MNTNSAELIRAHITSSVADCRVAPGAEYASVAIFVSAGGGRPAIRVLAWAGALIMPLAVGFSRVYRGMHHPLDVAAGLAMGAAVLVVVLAAFRAADVAAARAEPQLNGLAPLEREPA